jgi:hypothetical protein
VAYESIEIDMAAELAEWRSTGARTFALAVKG